MHTQVELQFKNKLFKIEAKFVLTTYDLKFDYNDT